ncbi:MAG: hypothetical protein IKU46_03165 [Peptococcaceae bacterium]|nr:hypothetical protein [Peptococcaceae bacterium]
MRWSEMNQKQRQNIIRLGLLAMLGVVLLCIGGRGEGTEQQSSQPTVQQAGTVSVQSSSSVSALERQLEQTLMQVKGAGDVTVQITVNDLGRKEYARDIQKTERNSTETNGDSRQQTTELQEHQTVVQQAGQGGALLIEETMPEIRGVLIVAAGACQASVQEQLLQAAATVLQLSTEQIMVLPGEGGAVHE